ncbi:hypothetical protein SAMN02745166_02756 [Prosthecobacter debontii]|uniref:Uncharacterized protein n=1 Tax=Prosthecobacter debontii TaxID=48467 RepID=A0A1T4Y9D4_9BACT|nr:hypothetical protein SAMN02745166_02756 [Prosthecobacter debontii]
MDKSPTGFPLEFDAVRQHTQGLNNPGLKDTSPLGLNATAPNQQSIIPSSRLAPPTTACNTTACAAGETGL